MSSIPTVTERHRCPSCQRTTTVHGTPADTAVALDAVRCRHRDGHATGARLPDDITLPGTSPRAAARARRADARAAERRRRATKRSA